MYNTNDILKQDLTFYRIISLTNTIEKSTQKINPWKVHPLALGFCDLISAWLLTLLFLPKKFNISDYILFSSFVKYTLLIVFFCPDVPVCRTVSAYLLWTWCGLLLLGTVNLLGRKLPGYFAAHCRRNCKHKHQVCILTQISYVVNNKCRFYEQHTWQTLTYL